MKRVLFLFVMLAATGLVLASANADIKPKYGPEATTLSQSHEYFHESKAPDYWALSPYYAAQQDGRSCSLASVTMVVNAARAARKLTADDELATQPTVLKKAGDEEWVKALGIGGRGVVLDQLKVFIEEALKAFGIDHFSVHVVHTDDASAKTKASLHRDLIENEKSSDNFMIINFIQGVYTGDAPVGHIAPIAAYDAKRKRVLVMDPDREWYEPYWVSEETLLKGMATQDKESGHARGYLFIKILKK